MLFTYPFLLRSDQIILRNLQFQERVRLKEDNQNMQNKGENPRHEYMHILPNSFTPDAGPSLPPFQRPPRITIRRYVSEHIPPNPARHRYPRVDSRPHTRHVRRKFRCRGRHVPLDPRRRPHSVVRERVPPTAGPAGLSSQIRRGALSIVDGEDLRDDWVWERLRARHPNFFTPYLFDYIWFRFYGGVESLYKLDQI